MIAFSPGTVAKTAIARRGLIGSLLINRPLRFTENTICFTIDLNFPAEQEASPCETGPKARHKDQILSLNLFRFDSF